MIDIQLNGETHQVPVGATVADLIVSLGLADKRIAVEYNQEILPKSRHTQTQLCDADRVEVVHAIGGG